MDDDQRRREMNELLARIADEQARADLSQRFDAALAAWQSAGTPEEKASQEKTLDAIRTEAQQAAGGGGTGSGTSRPVGGGAAPGSRQGSFMSTAAFLLVAGVIAASSAFVFFYFDEPGAANFTPDGSVRPLLVLTLIIAMLGFGGLLIVRALFSPEPFDKLSERFRLAREIFLVFAGTFGTIVGFYFGSETDNDDESTAPTVVVGYADGRLSATVSGGHEPFLGIYTPEGQDGGRTMTADERLLSLAISECPAGAKIVVVDGRGQRAEADVDCGPAEGGGNVVIAPPADTNAPAANEANGL